MEKKALFFDIDGTLLTNDGLELPASAADAVKRARQAGHLVFINSGRTRCLMKDVEKSLEVDGYLCGCGTYIEVGGKKVLHHLIGKERRLEIQKNIIQCGLDGILEGPFGCCVQSGISRMPEVERVKRLFEESGALYCADWENETVLFDKCCVLADDTSDVDKFLSLLGEDMAAIDRGHGLYECVPAGFDKATAIEFILKYFGISWEQSYAFGDSSNDLAMIRYACNSVVMGRHDKVLEPYAAFITKNVEDDGIAYAFEKLNILS